MMKKQQKIERNFWNTIFGDAVVLNMIISNYFVAEYKNLPQNLKLECKP